MLEAKDVGVQEHILPSGQDESGKKVLMQPQACPSFKGNPHYLIAGADIPVPRTVLRLFAGPIVLQ